MSVTTGGSGAEDAKDNLAKMDRGNTDQLEEIGETREELEQLVGATPAGDNQGNEPNLGPEDKMPSMTDEERAEYDERMANSGVDHREDDAEADWLMDRQMWVESINVPSETGHTDQLAESLSPQQVEGYIKYHEVYSNIIARVLQERNRQQNLGYTIERDGGHGSIFLVELATRLLLPVRLDQQEHSDKEGRAHIIIEAMAVLMAELERMAGDAGD